MKFKLGTMMAYGYKACEIKYSSYVITDIKAENEDVIDEDEFLRLI